MSEQRKRQDAEALRKLFGMPEPVRPEWLKDLPSWDEIHGLTTATGRDIERRQQAAESQRRSKETI